MKKTLLAACLLLFAGLTFAQETSKITVNGAAQKIFYPKTCKITFFLQEEIKTENTKAVSKTTIDSIKQVFFTGAKAYGLKESDFILIKKSSIPYNGFGGHNVSNLYNVTYQLRNQKFEVAQKVVDNLRTIGLKGAVAKPQYAPITRLVQDSLYAAAVDDAHSTAINMAKQANKTVGEVLTINSGYNALRDLNTDYDPNDAYNLTRFEISLVESKTFPVTATITYELKK